MIEVTNLSRRFGDLLAIEDLSFSVGEGEVLGLLGPNGAGKTTTLRILTGLLGPSSGDAVVAGHDLRRRSQAARQALGYLPEVPPLHPAMTVADYVDFAARLRKVPRKRRQAAVTKALSRTGLSEVADRVIGHLSKGFRQRVGLAQALVHEPKVLILDEPTSGLDPAQVAEMRALIGELRGGRTIILSTHILSEVTATCDRILILDRGRAVAQGTEDELRGKLAGGLQQELVLARPTADTSERLAGVPGVTAVERIRDGHFRVRLNDPATREALNVACAPWGLLESRAELGLEALYLRAIAGELSEAAR